MYLKKLEIKGFKTFADNTEISLKPGINIIVGPNGCGKSNLVDAIRWVLGESNVRQLRGQKSEDVIFNGTDKSRALGMANVEITVDNSDNILPIDYSEVTVGRKIFRSGESEFYLNKSRVRMKDIGALFAGTGLGKRGYSIIGQGELEQVLNGQALDRRLILEEASGIIKHRQQRDEVKKRIADTGNDLLRLGDILGELSQHKEELHKKADKAEAYLELNEECQDLQYKVLQFELGKTTRELKQKQQDFLTEQEELRNITGKLEVKEAELCKEEKFLAQKRDLLNQLKEEKHRLESSINSILSDIKLREERVKNKRERITVAEADTDRYAQMLKNLSQDIAKNRKDYEQEREELQKKLREYQRLEEEVNKLESIIEEELRQFDAKKEHVFHKTEDETRVKNDFRQAEETLKRQREKRDRLNIRIEDLSNRLNKQRRDYAELVEQKNRDKDKIAILEKEFEQLEKERNEFDAELRGVKQQGEILNQEIIKINNSIISIKDMQKNLVGYSPAVKFIMRSKTKLPGMLGLVGDLIDVPQGLELAIDAAAGKGLENMVVDKAEHAEIAINLLKKNGVGRVTFLPLDMLKVQEVPEHIVNELQQKDGVVGLASRLVRYDPRYEKAVQYLLGRVVIVEDLKKGVNLFKNIRHSLRIVSLDGEIINTSGAMTGGSRGSHNNSPLQQKGEEKRLLQQKNQKEKELADNCNIFEELSEHVAALEKRLASQKNNLMEVKFRYEMVSKQVNDAENYIKKAENERNLLFGQADEIEQEINHLDVQIIELHKKQSQMHEESEKVAQELELLKEGIDNKKRDLEVYRERLISYQEQLDMKKREIENLDKNIAQFEQVKLSYQESKQEANELKDRLTKEITGESQKIEQLKQEKAEKNGELDKIKETIIVLQNEEKGHLANIKRLQDDILPLKQQVSKLENQSRNLEINIARIETELTNLKQKWRDTFHREPPVHFEQDHTPEENREYKKKIQVLQQKIEEIGSVDVESIREYKEICERANFISQQYEDLNNARESLEKLLSETERLMNKSFSQFLLLANESFKKTFTEIFGGGDAHLRLEPDDNKLEAGVEIEVKMPGKKSQSLSLLSGGERALTCIAFIFALLRLKPAPFCLLDEIDAALDESNLVRFSRFIKKMSDEIQFIIITHRQATIEAGENIYGVTMPEKGISSVLTLSMEEVDSLAG